MELTNDQWKIIGPFFQKRKPRRDGKGRPIQDLRMVLEGILWILRSGARWKDLPREFPPYQTCHRYFQAWVKAKLLRKILKRLAEDLRDRGELDLTETFIDGSFASAKKGALKSGKARRARGPRSWQLRTAMVYLSPLGLKVLIHMKYDWWKIHSKTTLPEKHLLELSETKPTIVILLMNAWQRNLEPNLLLHINPIESQNLHKMEESSEDTDDAGEWKDFLLGYKIFDELLHDGSTSKKIF